MPDPQTPALSPEALLSEIISGYDIQLPAACTVLVSGRHDTFLVSSGEDRFVLKVYRLGSKTRPDVLAEIDALLHLGRKSDRIAQPVMRRDGTYAWDLSTPRGERQALLFTCAKGKSVSVLDARSCRLLGRALADIHNAADDYDSARAPYDLFVLLRPLWILGNIIRTHRPRPEGGLPDPGFFDQMLQFMRRWEEAYVQP